MKRTRTHDVKLEMAVVGSSMRDRDNFVENCRVIKRAEMFYLYAHQQCWKAMYRMHREGLPFGPDTLADVLHKEGAITDVRYEYLVDLWDASMSASTAHLAKTVVGLYVRRTAQASMQDIAKEVVEADREPAEVLTDALRQLGMLAMDVEPDDDPDEVDEAAKGYVTFPTVHLPAWVQDFVISGAEALYCDPAFLAVPALVAVGAAIGNSRVIEIKETWREPSIFWAATVADSSSMKSPAYDFATAPLWNLQRGMSDEYESHWKRYRDDMDTWNERRYSKNRKAGDGDDEKRPEKPVPKTIIVSDITIEKLAHVMWENPHGVVLCRDELKGWFGSFGRYTDGGGGGADMSAWLQLFGGRTLKVDRKTGDPPSITIRRASCSVVGTIQPAILQRTLTDDFFDSGMTSRILLSMPPRREKEWTENIIPATVYDAYGDSIRGIYETGQQLLDWNNHDPVKIGFTPSGKEAWIDFYQQWAKKQRDAEGEYVYALAKLEAYCARFCLLLSIADKQASPGNRDCIKASHVEDAFGLVNWFANEAQRVYTRLRTPADEQARNRLVEVIQQRQGVITARDLRRTNPKKYLTPEDASKALDDLVAKGLGQWVMKIHGEKGGKPCKLFQLSVAITGTSQN